jgi:RNA polymerase sigma-70 factor (ECF subfamily)
MACPNPIFMQDCTVPDTRDRKEFFSRSIRANMSALYSVALRLTRNGADAEDLVAETASKAWSAIGSLEDETCFRPWIFSILRNCYFSHYRKRRVRPIETAYDEAPGIEEDSEIAALLIQQPDEFLAWWANPEREVMNKVLGSNLLAAIERLPEAFREVVVLINVDGLSYDEAAEVLGVSPGTIRSRMNRGRTLLQKALWQHAQDAGLAPDPRMVEQSS